MGANLSISGTIHLRAMLNAALDSDSGIRLVGIPRGRAIQLRNALHNLRTQDRKNAKKIYPDPEDMNHGRSAYDCLLTEIIPHDEDTVTLRIIRADASMTDIEIVDDVTGKPIDLDEFK